MKRYIVQSGLIARLVLLALSALCLLPAQARAQGMTSYIVIFPSVGLAPGQSLRLTLFNPDGAPVRAEARLHHSNGVLVALGDGSVRGGSFHSFDFKRSDIPLPGEAGTGRIQLRSSVRLTFSEAISPVPVSMEIVDVTDGTSNTIFVWEKTPAPIRGNGNDILSSGFGNDILMGIAPGQTLRVTLINPSSSESNAQHKPASGQVKLFDARGALIAQSEELVIPPGEFRSFDFNRAALNLPGEPDTGRLQVRAQLIMRMAFRDDPKASSLLVPSLEILDNNTGRTRQLYNPYITVDFPEMSTGGTAARP